MQFVEKHIINRDHPLGKEFDQLAFKSKDLYKPANHIQPQYFFDTVPDVEVRIPAHKRAGECHWFYWSDEVLKERLSPKSQEILCF